MAGLVVGTAVTFVWELTPPLASWLYELIPAFAAGALATVLVSRLTRRPGEVDAMFRAMRRREEPRT